MRCRGGLVIVVVTVFVQGTGLDRRTGREFFQPAHFGFEGVYARLQLSDEGVPVFVDGLVSLEQGEEQLDDRSEFLGGDCRQWR